MKVYPFSSSINGILAFYFVLLLGATTMSPSNAFLAPTYPAVGGIKKPVVQQNTIPYAPLTSSVSMVRPGGTTSTTALHANLVDRFIRVARGNVNSVLSRFEDPEKVMDQALSEMQNDIAKIRQTYAEATAGQRRLLSQKAQYESVADDWYRRAQLALKTSNNEGLAREALARREQALQKAATFQQQVDGQAANLDKLYEGMKALEGQILRAQTRKSELASRAKTAQSTVWVNDMLSGLSGTTSMDAFRRMEDKVAALEASAEVSADMLLSSSNALLSRPSLMESSSTSTTMNIELEFQRLESSDAVEQELEKLRAKMLPSSSSHHGRETIRIPVRDVVQESMVN
jgi:phage shock protein A